MLNDCSFSKMFVCVGSSYSSSAQERILIQRFKHSEGNAAGSPWVYTSKKFLFLIKTIQVQGMH